MTHYNYYEKMQELSYRAMMALVPLNNEGLKDFYSAAEEGFNQKLQKLSVEEAKEPINQSHIEQYLTLKDFVDQKEREAAEKIKQEQIEAAEQFKPTAGRTEITEEEIEQEFEDNQVYEEKLEAKIKALHD